MDQYLVLASGTLTAVGLLAYLSTPKIPAKAPTGPRRLPLLGNILDFGTDPPVALHEIAKRYPEGIYSLQLGSVFAVIVSKPSLIREVFSKKGNRSSGRWNTEGFSMVPHDIVGAPYGSRWRKLRKFSHQALFSGNALKKSQAALQSGLARMVTKLETHAKEGTMFHLLRFTQGFTIEVTLKLVFSIESNQQEEIDRFTTNIGELFVLFGVGNPADLFPFLRRFPRAYKKKLETLVGEEREFCLKHVKEHKARLNINKPPEDFTDMLLHTREQAEYKGDEEFANELSDVALAEVLIDMINGGTDTTADTISWLILLLITHPQVQKKVVQELDEFKRANGNLPSDLNQLPYLNATLKESMRFRTVGPLAVPHSADGEIEVGDYVIPEGSVLMMNIYSVHNDKEAWGDPEVFRPERFLTLEPTKEQEIFMPFGIGPRDCLGRNLAMQTLSTVLPQIFHQFEFSCSSPVSLKPVFGLAYAPQPHNIAVKKRV